jgi:hypothetical protein
MLNLEQLEVFSDSTMTVGLSPGTRPSRPYLETHGLVGAEVVAPGHPPHPTVVVGTPVVVVDAGRTGPEADVEPPAQTELVGAVTGCPLIIVTVRGAERHVVSRPTRRLVQAVPCTLHTAVYKRRCTLQSL